MLLLARFELRRAVRRATQAMAESVATTVAACVPDIAHAVRGDEGNGAAAPVEAQRAEALRRVALDTVATVMARERWLGDWAICACPTRRCWPAAAAPARIRCCWWRRSPWSGLPGGATRVRGRSRRAAGDAARGQALQDSVRHWLARPSASTRDRCHRAAFRAGQRAGGGRRRGDYQRLLIQKYNALGLREKEVAQQRGRCRQQAHDSAEDAGPAGCRGAPAAGGNCCR